MSEPTRRPPLEAAVARLCNLVEALGHAVGNGAAANETAWVRSVDAVGRLVTELEAQGRRIAAMERTQAELLEELRAISKEI